MSGGSSGADSGTGSDAIKGAGSGFVRPGRFDFKDLGAKWHRHAQAVPYILDRAAEHLSDRSQDSITL